MPNFQYRNDPKFSDRQVLANSVDPDQSLIRVYTVCHSIYSFWTHYILYVKATLIEHLGWLPQKFRVSEFLRVLLYLWWRNWCPALSVRDLSVKDGVATFDLTHICLVDPSILIKWTSPFPILGVPGVLFHFYSTSNRYREQWRPCSECGVWSGSALFACVPKMVC